MNASSEHPHHDVASTQETPSVVYNIQTSFDDLDKRILVAGSITVYLFEMLCTHPFEVIRTQIQTSQTVSSIEILKRNLNQGGLKSLYAGFMPAVVGHMPGNTLYLLTYTWLKDALQKFDNARHVNRATDGRQAPWVSAAAAAGADLAAVSLYVPVDVVSQRLFVQSPTGGHIYSGWREVVNTIMKHEGWRGFYKGVGPILANSLPASALWWTLYEESKRILSRKFHEYSREGKTSEKSSSASSSSSSPFETSSSVEVIPKSPLASFISGGLAGAIVTVATNPLDVVTTRLQTQSMKAEAYQYRNSFHAIKEIWRAEGLRAFFKGTTPRLTSWVFMSSASAFAYEFIVDLATIKK